VYQQKCKHADSYRYVMIPELYSTLTQDKVIKEAALRSGVSQGVHKDCPCFLPSKAMQVSKNNKGCTRIDAVFVMMSFA
jgi:hypothetical protein